MCELSINQQSRTTCPWGLNVVAKSDDEAQDEAGETVESYVKEQISGLSRSVIRHTSHFVN